MIANSATSQAFFFWLVIYIYIERECYIKKMETAKIMCFLKFSVAKIRQKFERKSPNFIYGVQEASQKY